MESRYKIYNNIIICTVFSYIKRLLIFFKECKDKSEEFWKVPSTTMCQSTELSVIEDCWVRILHVRGLCRVKRITKSQTPKLWHSMGR